MKTICLLCSGANSAQVFTTSWTGSIHREVLSILGAALRDPKRSHYLYKVPLSTEKP